MKRNLIIIVIIVLVVLLGAGLYFLLGGKSSPNSNSKIPAAGTLPQANQSSTSNSGTSGDFATIPDYLGRSSQVFGSLPTSTYLSIGTSEGTVQVNNFYLSDPPVNQDQEVIVQQADGYLITYNPSDSSFWLDITGMPFATARTGAEAGFLQALNISEADACKLNVTIGVVYSPGNPEDGASLPLSFCSHGAFSN